jgi:hypothetical protein
MGSRSQINNKTMNTAKMIRELETTFAGLKKQGVALLADARKTDKQERTRLRPRIQELQEKLSALKKKAESLIAAA